MLFLLVVASFGTEAYQLRSTSSKSNRVGILASRQQINSRLSAEAAPSTTSPEGTFQKFECTSCAYIYDEEKGFKKRYPAGTKWASLQTFACPVCGAAKDKFTPVAADK